MLGQYMIILLVDIKLQLMVVKHCTPRGPNAQAACFRQVFFLLLALYDVSDVAHDEYDCLRRTALYLSTCCSNLLFVRDS